MQKFKRVQAENKLAISKHLEANAHLESSSEDENDRGEDNMQNVIGKILSAYQGEETDAEKILSYLINIFQSGNAVCLICISTVKRADPIWNCNKCFAFLHLSCISRWIQDSVNVKREKGIEPTWACPKCRMEYKEDDSPRKYTCFCKKTTNPPYNPWNIPHSCGETCDKLLQPECGHKCVLLCHPGPCPPCAKTVSIKCYCGKQAPQQRRCNTKNWSCGAICNKKYESCSHTCKKVCHSEKCPPCSEILSLECHCKSNKELKRCSKGPWTCDKLCDKPFSCNVHTCEGKCHLDDDCGTCPLEKNRTCPCGKKRYAVSCNQEQLPTCGDTCGKLLNCGSHYCNMRCHMDRCGQCLEVITKSCRCGSYKKEVACGKEFHCNKKCVQMRLCGRHSCNKKCCDCLIKNTYNACEKVCDNTLNCRKHKCAAPCHSGPCYPCARTDVIQCKCGHNKITVPCGTKRVKPPPCNRQCKIPPICHHSKRETHKCHQGYCPPCKKIFTCLGEHETFSWACHEAKPTSCGRLCGKTLPCKNHTCELICHKVPSSEETKNSTPCMDCESPCLLPRPAGCMHLCPKLCHAPPCNPCKQIVKTSCHCGISTIYRRCFELTSATVEKRNELLKCGNQCPKNYPCGHRCANECHLGPCKNEKECSKKMKLFCECRRIKKEFVCSVVQKEGISIKCDDVCMRLKNERRQAEVALLEQKRRAEEMRNQQEIEKFERKFKPRRKGKDKSDKNPSQNETRGNYERYWILGVLICLISVVIFYAIIEQS
ncbi:NF-X1-type zinc finger protein NFXL1 [Melipona quadrifasciata]|uniref:NF-X1-type zinc finger protein NFXL1 n=1 Tax=Melipona quadrifasciata TaxID=166423 RepID=A0A0N0BEV6_9HYME|nr:NF-X1-type zinc finger protein NFXL1 [Melipona quadrifasciata]